MSDSDIKMSSDGGAYVKAEHLACKNIYDRAEIYEGSAVADKREITRPHNVRSDR